VITNGRTSAIVVAGKWYLSTMRATIDSAGRLVVPKPLRDELGFAAGTELELAAVNGALEVRVPSRVRVEDGPHGLHFVADSADQLTDEQVRDLIEKSRR
jgi:AbrB family looped-hinge helix DNA binding protein